MSHLHCFIQLKKVFPYTKRFLSDFKSKNHFKKLCLNILRMFSQRTQQNQHFHPLHFFSKRFEKNVCYNLQAVQKLNNNISKCFIVHACYVFFYKAVQKVSAFIFGNLFVYCYGYTVPITF